MSQSFYKDADGKDFHLAKNSLSEVWDSDSIKSLRKNLVDGVKDSKCASCWNEESLGKFSKRNRENNRWQTSIELLVQNEFQPNPPAFLDLKLGNTCNLKCRICGPGSSSGWIKEWKDVTGEDQLADLSTSVIASQSDKRVIMAWPDANQKFWTDIETWLSSVKLFEIYGGEPFLIKQHFALLKKSVELGFSKNQRIHYNSNGTIFPEQAIAEIWPYFERVNIMLSIDGIGEQFEYQRHPAKWKDVEKNIFRFKDVFSTKDFHICLTVSSLNAYYLPEYLKYFNEIGIPVWLNLLYGPDYFSIKNLPQKAKNGILKKWESIGEEKAILLEPIDSLINFLKIDSYKVEEDKLLPNLKRHDEYRNEKYSDTFPEFAKLINY
jgi:MoaA/NifB/PqqE/SkfB family radical SAM enzyme